SCRESQFREDWWKRNEEILDMLLAKGSSVICLQEFWVGNEELVEMYERKLGNNGYEIYKFGRPMDCGDGLLTAVRKDHFRVVNYWGLLLNSNGNRVAQLLHLQSVIPFWRSQSGSIQQETLVVNTHLMFPHNSNVCLVRLRQVYKILEYLEAFKAEYSLPSVPIILCGDWNGSKRGHVYKFLRSQGFVSSYDTAHHYTDSDADAHKWVSHRNHRGNICGVDFIWLRNPTRCHKSLKISWNEAVLGIVKSKLHEAGLKDIDSFCFKSENSSVDCVKLSDFYEALQQLGLTEKKFTGLSTKEIEDLWAAVDIDRNGLVDYEEFQASATICCSLSLQMQRSYISHGIIVNSIGSVSYFGLFLILQRVLLGLPMEQSAAPVFGRQSAAQGKWLATNCSENSNRKASSEKPCCISTTVQLNGVLGEKVETETSASLRLFEIDGKLQDLEDMQELAIGFVVKKAFLFPPEVERGMWPDNYVLSDHAPLTVVFTPVMLPRTHETLCKPLTTDANNIVTVLDRR
ncbi:hypothetical protein KI387_032024, partial [Taxus chinensis]